MTVTIRTSRSTKARLLFRQGPMNNQQADEISERYRKRGNDVVIAPAFEGDGVCVFVYSGVTRHG